jgi:ferredoxin-NADP reductase
MGGSIDWQIATVKSVRPETSNVKTLTLALPKWMRHKAGQHYDVRLTAEDGYQAQRSYSIASEPERSGEVDLTVERIMEGEVSPYLMDVLIPGDRIEVRGPIGGYFVWDEHMKAPTLMIAGGSGIVPLMAMIRHRAAVHMNNPVRLLYSSRSLEDIIFYQELEQLQRKADGLEVFHTLTRSQPEGWQGYSRRIDRRMIAEVAAPLGGSLQAYICGPTLLVESAAEHLVQLGIPPSCIRTERFGPSSPEKGG